jgi:single-stranded DNA-binding protein
MTGEIECAFAGVCVKAPELKTSKSGNPFATFSLVLGDADNKRFIRVCAFGETAERVAAQLHVGGKAYCEGTLDASIWTPQGGEPRINLNVAARRVEVLGQIGKNRPRQPRQDAPPQNRYHEPVDDGRWH